MIADLERDEIERGLADGSILLVDVREPHEYAAGHVPGAVSHPLSGFDPAALADLAAEAGREGRRTVLACAAGVRSRRVLEWAQAAGVPLAEHYVGGWKDWVAAGGPVAEGEEPGG